MPHHGFLSRSDCDIYYEVTGSGPAIIFVHGLGGNYLSWWQQVPFFSERFCCVTFSQRGFWPSEKIPKIIGTSVFTDDLTSLIDHLRLEKVFLAAQSMGGWSCLEYSLRHPDRVRALVLSSTTGAVDHAKFPQPEIEKITAWGRYAEEKRKELELEKILAATGKRMFLEQRSLNYLYSALNDLTPPSFREAVRTTVRSERTMKPETAADLKTPVLFITGSEDLIFPPAAAEALAAYIQGAVVHREENAGHSVYFERAGSYNKVIAEFLSHH